MQRLRGGARHGGVGALAAAGTTGHLDVAALDADGSLSIPLGELTHYEFVKKMFRNYLSIRVKDASGQEQAFAFMNQYALPGGKEWQDEIDRARRGGE